MLLRKTLIDEHEEIFLWNSHAAIAVSYCFFAFSSIFAVITEIFTVVFRSLYLVMDVSSNTKHKHFRVLT